MLLWLKNLSNFFRRPPHGGRGLKSYMVEKGDKISQSPSPRRAWIEIVTKSVKTWRLAVALPTEGVD